MDEADDKPVVDCGVSEHRLSSWKEFGEYIANTHLNNDTYIYRGLPNADWKLLSTLDRLENRFPTKKNYSSNNPPFFSCPPVTREVHLEAFKEAARGKPGKPLQELSETEWWALAQHHGLATPLLDWTYSPFVALFFAFENEGYVDRSPNRPTYCASEHRVVYFTLCHMITGGDSDKHLSPTLFSPRREITYRLSSQSGVLMQMPPGVDLETSVRARFSKHTSASDNHAFAILTKITIPNKGRTECLKYLNKMNINRMSLYSDLDGAAAYINSLWELDFNTALGYLSDGTSQGNDR